jgi:hypothetical protein
MVFSTLYTPSSIETNRLDTLNLFSQPLACLKSVQAGHCLVQNLELGSQEARFCVHRLAVLQGACHVMRSLDQTSDLVAHQRMDIR